MESLTCWGMWLIKSYSIKVVKMTWKGFSCCFENDRIRNWYTLVVTSIFQDLQVNSVIFWCYSVLISHSNWICRREVFCTKLDENSSIIYQLVSNKDSVRLCTDQQIWWRSNAWHASWISTLQLLWNLISVESDEPFQHLDFHDGW